MCSALQTPMQPFLCGPRSYSRVMLLIIANCPTDGKLEYENLSARGRYIDITQNSLI